MREHIGKLVRFNSPSVGNYSTMHGSQNIVVEAEALGIMLDYSPENLCEVLLHGDVVYNIDPDYLDDVSDVKRNCI